VQSVSAEILKFELVVDANMDNLDSSKEAGVFARRFAEWMPKLLATLLSDVYELHAPRIIKSLQSLLQYFIGSTIVAIECAASL
jgi:hypothetical protein